MRIVPVTRTSLPMPRWSQVAGAELPQLVPHSVDHDKGEPRRYMVWSRFLTKSYIRCRSIRTWRGLINARQGAAVGSGTHDRE
jgi:hypothetical protein